MNTYLEELGAVLNALNHIEVHGEENLLNLSGSISVVKRIINHINQNDTSETVTEK